MGNFRYARSDLSSAALKPKYLEDKTHNIEIREALNIPKHSKKDPNPEPRSLNLWQLHGKQPWVFLYIFFKNLDTGNLTFYLTPGVELYKIL